MKIKISIISLCFLIACKSVEIAQIDIIKNRVRINVADTTILADVSTYNITPENQSNYFWFEKGRINSSQGGYSGKLLHGRYKSYYSHNKKLIEAGTFEKGLKNGYWLVWHDNGTLLRSSTYKRGVLNGLKVLYDTTGKPLDTLKYRSGILEIQKVDSSTFFLRFKNFLKLKRS